jgi:hypothetical protein
VIYLAARKKKLITSKEVADILKVSPELITYLRQSEALPFVKNNKYILYSEPEVLRWRNRHLAENSLPVLDLKEYYRIIELDKFITFDNFKERVSKIVFLEGNFVIQYIKRQNPTKDVVNLVGDIVSEYWSAREQKCRYCGGHVISDLDKDICAKCRKKIKGE